ncbi:MAG: RecX family transcriptional regulator [Anaerolineales bacterium]|nr:RecX family transcriptional regulator [Anaerolineales bacterium]
MEYKITAITVQKKNQNRVNIFLDGEYAFSLTIFVAAWLQSGQMVDDKKIEELKAKDNQEIAYQRSLKFLAHRPRSILEVEQRLGKYGHSPELIEMIIEKLIENNYLNEKDFAEYWVGNRIEFRPRGKTMLRYELRQKGISDQIIEETLTPLDESRLVYLAARKQARKLNHLELDDFRKKLSGHLARKGFGYADVAPIIEEIWQELH